MGRRLRRLIGTAWAWDSALTVPGGADVSLGAVTHVGVRADRTRRGVLSTLMRAQLTDLAERGAVAAGLHATEAAIYGRFGYGAATLGRDLRIQRARARVRDDAPAGGRVELHDLDGLIGRVPEVYPRAATRPGMLARPDAWWGMMRSHLTRPSATRPQGVTHEGPDGIDGFAVYTVERTKGDQAKLTVVDLHTANTAAAAGLWRYLLSVDLVDTIEAALRPVDEPLDLLLTDPRAVSTTDLGDDLWLRLIDVPAALAARTYGDEQLVAR
ncbi:GNAT family N-acetyltransferase [Saccharomonospora sp. CUA-673]|uniref:GNAT family N-acetyltransferase n=1 Tax=Saccharomonospora sp. CUA-673 TaxID=1904969 RepID=UPI003517A204